MGTVPFSASWCNNGFVGAGYGLGYGGDGCYGAGWGWGYGLADFGFYPESVPYFDLFPPVYYTYSDGAIAPISTIGSSWMGYGAVQTAADPPMASLRHMPLRISNPYYVEVVPVKDAKAKVPCPPKAAKGPCQEPKAAKGHCQKAKGRPEAAGDTWPWNY